MAVGIDKKDSGMLGIRSIFSKYVLKYDSFTDATNSTNLIAFRKQ